VQTRSADVLARVAHRYDELSAGAGHRPMLLLSLAYFRRGRASYRGSSTP
jgi:hypothetical protein